MFDLLIPPRCLGCRRPGPIPFCAECADLLEPDGELHRFDAHTATVAAFAYRPPISTAIKAVKTDGLRAGADALARLLELPTGTAVTWVPAPARRRRRRGLDLPQHLAGPDAVCLLERLGRPPEQPGLTADQRRAAQRGSFAATARLCGPVVLVDDVRATGATLLAAAEALRRAGASRVLGVTLAGAGGPPSAGRRPHRRRGTAAASAPTW